MARRGIAMRNLACAAAILAWLCQPGADAHPHDEEEGDLQQHVAQVLHQLGKPCASVLNVEETPSAYIIICEVNQDGRMAQVVYSVAKPN